MAGLPWSRAGFDHTAESRANVELLETDVMRFMAILGFCLMAIFALVQSIPPAALTTEAQTTTVVPPSALMDDARTKLEQLNQQLGEIATEVEKARLERDSTLATLGSLKTSEQALAQRQSRARAHYRQQLANIATAEQKLRTEEHALSALQARRETAPTTVDTSQTAKTEERRQPKDTIAKPIDNAPAPVHTAHARTPAPTPTAHAASTPVPTPTPTADAASTPISERSPEKPEQRSFVLRFASDTSLRALIAQHEVGFFAFVGDESWRLELDTDVLKYQRAPKPKSYHEMTPATVPPAFIQALQGTVKSDPRRGTGWGVTLPRTVQKQIQRHMQSGTGGTLVIYPDGRVRLGTNTTGS